MNRNEEDLELVLADLSAQMEQVADSKTRSTFINEALRSVKEAEELIGQIELEAINYPSNERAAIQLRLRNQANQVQQSKKEILNYKESSNREELYRNSRELSQDSEMDDQRSRLLYETQKIERSSERIKNSQRIASETEGIGASILNDLYGQREQILHARDQLYETDGFLDRSIGTIHVMTRRYKFLK